MLIHKSRRLHLEWTGPRTTGQRFVALATGVRFMFPYASRSAFLRVGSLLIGVGIGCRQ